MTRKVADRRTLSGKWRKGPGRQPLPGGREPFNTTLPPHVKRWLQRDGNASAKIVAWVEAEIAKERSEAP